MCRGSVSTESPSDTPTAIEARGCACGFDAALAPTAIAQGQWQAFYLPRNIEKSGQPTTPVRILPPTLKKIAHQGPDEIITGTARVRTHPSSGWHAFKDPSLTKA